MKEIVLADTMGFCWGVRRTLDIVREATADSEPIAMIGDAIHNPQVVSDLEQRGVFSVDTVDDAVSNGFSRIGTTAHGTVPERDDEAKSLGIELVDTTCPLVTRVQRRAEKLARQGYFLVIYGDAAHPEAKGILGWSKTSRATIAMHVDDLPWASNRASASEDEESPPRKIAILSQTTKNEEGFLAFAHDVLDLVIPSGGEVQVCNTICEPTVARQSALRELSDEVDAIIVIGGRKSSNTARLAEVGRSLGRPSYHIERPDEISDRWLEGVDRVGVTAGASTPDRAILAVIDALKDRGYTLPADASEALAQSPVPAF